MFLKTLQRVSPWPFDHFPAIKNEIKRFGFELCETKDKIKGIITGFSNNHGNLFRHNNDRILFSNNLCFLWYCNNADTCYSVVVASLLTRTLLESFATGLSHLNARTLRFISISTLLISDSFFFRFSPQKTCQEKKVEFSIPNRFF